MAVLGTGTTISYQSGFMAEITDVNLSGWSRGAVRTSHFGTTGAHTYMPTTLQESGQIQVTLQWDPEANPVTPMAAAAESVVITFADPGPASTLTVTAFAIGFELTAPFEERLEAVVTLQNSGLIAHG